MVATTNGLHGSAMKFWRSVGKLIGFVFVAFAVSLTVAVGCVWLRLMWRASTWIMNAV